MPQKKKTITVDMDKVQPITVSAADVSPISSQPDPQAELKQRYGLPPSADLSKPFFDPANKSVKDAIAFSKAYAELNPPAPPKEGFFPSAGAEAKGLLSGMFSHPSPAVGAEWAQGVADNPINALPIVGPMLTARAKQAKTDVPGAIGAGLIDIAALGSPLLFNKNLRGKVTGAPAAAREAIGARLYTPAGEMKPTPKMAAQVGGGLAGTAAGAAVAHPYIGAAAGYKMGPALLERAFPEPAVAGAARETFAKTKMITEAQEAATKQNVAVDRLAAKKAAGEGPEPFQPFKPSPRVKDMIRSTTTAEPGVPKGPSYENRGLLQSRPGGMAPAKPSPSTAEAGEAGRYGMNKGAMGWEEQKVRSIVNATTITPSDYVFMTRRFGPNWRKMSAEQLMGHASASRPPRVE